MYLCIWFALRWFLKLLETSVARNVPLLDAPSTQKVILYSDADGSGNIGAVAVFPDDEVLYLHGTIPNRVTRQLTRRKTNIVAYELLAAMVALTSLCLDRLRGTQVIHFIDSTPALACVVKGFSREEDLAMLSGRLWYEASNVMSSYHAAYVPSDQNLADGPSRKDFRIMETVRAQEVTGWNFPSFAGGLAGWLADETGFQKTVDA